MRAFFITAAQRRTLLVNGQLSAAHPGQTIDHRPVVKLFTPDGQATWLLTEIDPDNPDQAFGLCDLGLGSPELGRMSLNELFQARGRLHLPIERDRYFQSTKPLSAYAEQARFSRRIIA